MSLDYEKKKFKILKDMVDAYKKELLENRRVALDMPIETDNGFNVERETLIDDIDEKLEILKRHSNEPYFAKLIFKDENDGEEFNGYIGRLSIGDISNQSDEKVVDWRAPISDLYYNGRLGHSEYTANGDTYEVDLKLKRQIEIKDNEVKSIYDFEEAVSSDEFLKPFLTQSANNRLKSIVSTIQEEQNRIIRLPLYQNCIVQGVAGSGKTTVALHRISYLMYNYKKQIRPEEFLIISPNEIFMSYISSILVDLDADKSNSFSLNKMIENVLGSEYKILNKHDQYKYLVSKKISNDYLSFKNKKDFKTILDKFLTDYKEKIFKRAIVVNGVELLDKEIVYKYFNNTNLNFTELSLQGSKKLGLALSYDEKLKNLAIANIKNSNIDIHKKFKIISELENGKFGFIKKNFKVDTNPIKVYKDFITNIEKFTDYAEVNILKKYTIDNIKNKTLAYDDLASILYILTNLIELPYYNGLKCVLIDEAQDLSELMYIALKKMFPKATFAIFGDIAQGIYSYQSVENWDKVMDILDTPQLLYLNRSYRTTIEIMEEANKTLIEIGTKPANNVIRNGEQVDCIKENDIISIKKLLDKFKDKYATTAIICKDDNELKVAQEKLSQLNLTVIDENNINYGKNQNIILTVQTAKGLEFDAVILYDHSTYSHNLIDLKLLYVAKTRALHKLVMCGCKDNTK